MSTIVISAIRCDHPECDEIFSTGRPGDATKVRERMFKAGWCTTIAVQINGVKQRVKALSAGPMHGLKPQDFCPAHVPTDIKTDPRKAKFTWLNHN